MIHTMNYNGFEYVRVTEVAKARAEVLAACVGWLKNREANHRTRANELVASEGHTDRAGYQYNMAEAFRMDAFKLLNLQPAAKDLEELLRQAELRGLRLDPPKRMHRICELEKARASEKRKV